MKIKITLKDRETAQDCAIEFNRAFAHRSGGNVLVLAADKTVTLRGDYASIYLMAKLEEFETIYNS